MDSQEQVRKGAGGDSEGTTFDRIELRSEKVRNILCEMPTRTLRWSLAILVAITVILVCVALLVPYPYGDGESILLHYL